MKLHYLGCITSDASWTDVEFKLLQSRINWLELLQVVLAHALSNNSFCMFINWICKPHLCSSFFICLYNKKNLWPMLIDICLMYWVGLESPVFVSNWRVFDILDGFGICLFMVLWAKEGVCWCLECFVLYLSFVFILFPNCCSLFSP